MSILSVRVGGDGCGRLELREIGVSGWRCSLSVRIRLGRRMRFFFKGCRRVRSRCCGHVAGHVSEWDWFSPLLRGCSKFRIPCLGGRYIGFGPRVGCSAALQARGWLGLVDGTSVAALWARIRGHRSWPVSLNPHTAGCIVISGKEYPRVFGVDGLGSGFLVAF